MRRMRLLVAAMVAVLGISAVAYAQTVENQYTVGGSVPAGGSKSKPKPGGFNFQFGITAPGGVVPKVIQTYDLFVEGGRVNTKVIPKGCTAAQMERVQSDRVCPKGTMIGSGRLKVLAGTTGQPTSSAVACDLPVKLYNAGNNKATIWIQVGQGDCVAALTRGIEARWVKSANGTSLRFTVPPDLRKILNLDIVVTGVNVTFKKITRKIKGKTVGYFESVGCKDRKRDLIGKFTDEAGVSGTAKKTLARC